MKRRLPALALFGSVLALAGCGRLDLLTTDVTPERWLATHPHLQIQLGGLRFTLAEPSSSLIVYGLGFILAYAGLVFLRDRKGGRSRLLWGLGLLAWALSTFLAGTSYQAFAYEIKCAGREFCAWTSWWEIGYLLVFTASMDLLAAAVAFSSLSGARRRLLVAYAAANALVYAGIVLAGALIPDRFLASFECMLLFTGPTFLILFAVNLSAYRKTRRPLELGLLVAWLLLFAVIVAYFAYLLSGFAEALWAKGVWFNANDVLHLGLVLWVLYLLARIHPQVSDAD